MSETTLNPVGRPRKILSEQEIAKLIGKGFTVQFVADYFSVSESLLYREYKEALRKGYAFRNGCLQAKQFKDAMKGNATLQIWLGKQWLNQTDKSEVKATVQNEYPEFGNLTDEQLNQIRSIVDSAERVG